MICNSQDGYNRLILIRNSILMTHRGLAFGLTAYALLITEAIGTYTGIHFLWVSKAAES